MPDPRLEENLNKEMPKLPDELYITALNDNGEEKQSKKSDRFF